MTPPVQSFSPMLEVKIGDIFTQRVDVWVNPTNARGISGAGLALQFRTRYPDMAQQYNQWCLQQKGTTKSWPIGQCWLWQVPAVKQPPTAVVCLPTKLDWRDPAKIEWVESGMDSLLKIMQAHRYRTVALPALGCGLGGLDVLDVKPRIEQAILRSSTIRATLIVSKEDLARLAPEKPMVRVNESPEFAGPVRPMLARGRNL